MKSCVMTVNFSCDPNKVWLYMTNPRLAGWRTDLSDAAISSDGMQVTETHKDGSVTQIAFTRKEKPRALSCTFRNGKRSGSFTAILLGGADSTSVECTFEINGVGPFGKPQKLLEPRLEMLRSALGQ